VAHLLIELFFGDTFHNGKLLALIFEVSILFGQVLTIELTLAFWIIQVLGPLYF